MIHNNVFNFKNIKLQQVSDLSGPSSGSTLTAVYTTITKQYLNILHVQDIKILGAFVG